MALTGAMGLIELTNMLASASTRLTPFVSSKLFDLRASRVRHEVMARVITGKTVVVTGASQGIGLEFARQLLQKGNTVVAAVRNPTSGIGLQQLQQSTTANKLYVTTLDVSQPSSIRQWASEIQEICSQLTHVDVLINNAGILGPDVTLEDVTLEDMTSVLVTNAVGPLLIVQQLLKQGLLGGLAGPSLIANIASKMASVEDNTSGGEYPYRASKSALNIINRSLSVDLAEQGITSVLLHPGYVRTRMTDGEGLINADESVSGMLSVLEGNKPLNGHFYAFDGKEIPW